MDQDNPLGYFSRVNYRIIREISNYLILQDIINFQSTNSLIKETINLRHKRVTRNSEEKVRNNQIRLYLGCDIQDIYEKIVGIVVQISSKDQGWASASYSTSWVTLSLYNNDADYQNHGQQENEQIIHENFKVEHYKTIKKNLIYLYEKIEKDKKTNITLPTILYQAKQGAYQNIGIVLKCQYPGWECHMRDAELRVYYCD